jgi:hypothetical protein
LIAELETRVEQLKASEVDMKNLFYREKEARGVLEYDYKKLAYECDKHMELRIASDHDLVNCYKFLQKLNEDCKKLRAQLKELEEAALPIARLLVSGIHPGYSCKEGRRVEDGLLIEFPCTPTRTRSV